MASPCADLLQDIGGGAPEGSAIKGRRLAAPRADASPPTAWTSPSTYESLRRLGGMMGSGGLVVTDSGTCMVNSPSSFSDHPA